MFKTDENRRAYGCIFCVTGKELAVVRLIERVCEDVRAIAARQLKRMTVHGESHLEDKILYPGYVFFEAPVHAETLERFPRDANILSVLKSGNDDWQLYGEDAKLVEWLFSYEGLLPISKAYKEGDWVQITSGPLMDLAGQIVRFDKHHKSAQVAITFCNRPVAFWLNFEFVDEAKMDTYTERMGGA